MHVDIFIIERSVERIKPNGRIWLESEVGKVSTFFILLPVEGPDDEDGPGSGTLRI
jgi:signal transduction histidine kinase